MDISLDGITMRPAAVRTRELSGLSTNLITRCVDIIRVGHLLTILTKISTSFIFYRCSSMAADKYRSTMIYSDLYSTCRRFDGLSTGILIVRIYLRKQNRVTTDTINMTVRVDPGFLVMGGIVETPIASRPRHRRRRDGWGLGGPVPLPRKK